MDGENNTFEMLQYIVVGEPEHAVAAGYEPFIASVIVTHALFKIMAFAIDFDNELAGMRDEVGDVISHRALPAKSEPGKSMRFQLTPQQDFGARHRAPQLFGAGSLNLVHRSVRHTPLPDPPPQGGREQTEFASTDRQLGNHSFPITSPRKP
jgi:hypothetical protein